MPTENLEGKLSAEEREDSRVAEIFTANLPSPETPSGTDRTQILRYLASEPSLTKFRKSGLERFLSNTGVLPDGRVICTLTALDERLLRPLVWGSRFGACLRLLIKTPKVPLQAVFIPDEKSFDALHSHRIVTVSYRMERIQRIQEYDLSSSVEAKSAFESLLTRCEQAHADITNDDNTCMFSADLIRASSVSPNLFSEYWTRLEWLQHGWINACGEIRYRWAASLIKEKRSDFIHANNIVELHTNYDLLSKTISILASSELSVSAKIKEVIAGFKSYRLNELYFQAVTFENEHKSLDPEALRAFTSARDVAFYLWDLLELDADLSDWGRLQISWTPNDEKFKPIEIDYAHFAIEQDRDAGIYWWAKRPEMLLHRDVLLSASDLPLDVPSFVQGMADWQVDLDEMEAKKTISHLLSEAVALREWTIPPNAYVEISAGPFVGAEVTEIGNDVIFVWRTANNRYWDMTVGTDNQIIVGAEYSAPSFNRSAALSIQLLMSAVIRDFWVVEERQKIFGVKVRRADRVHSDTHKSRVVYLPRVRYLDSKIDLSRLNLELSYKQRSQHYVSPHFRKAKPSQLQLEIARRAQKIVPDGHTYIQGHYRGVEGGEGQTVYRSRSAMGLLFEATPSDLRQADYLSTTDWFGFEKAISILLEKKFNFTIEHRDTRGKTDYGIDILATKTTAGQIETWIIQCKCYKPTNLVGPSQMRELIGSIADLQSEGVDPVRGMMVTTSRFTGDALSLAVKHGIQCVAGTELNLILDSINKASM